MMKRPPPGVDPEQWERGKEFVKALPDDQLDALEAELLAKPSADGDLFRLTDSVHAAAQATLADMHAAGLKHRRTKMLPAEIDALVSGIQSLSSLIDARAEDEADADFYKRELLAVVRAALYLGAETIDAKHTTLRNAAAGKRRAARAAEARSTAAADKGQIIQAIVDRHAARYSRAPGHSKHKTTTIALEIEASVNAALRSKGLPPLKARSIERRIRSAK